MPRWMRTPSAVRSTAVLGLGALCLHQLVYLMSFGAGAGHALDTRGHGYLSFAAPMLAVVAVCAVLASLLVATRRARGPMSGRRGVSWLCSSLVLLALFGVQEAIEVALRTGSLGEMPSLVHQLGLVAVVAAIAVGRLVGVALSGLDAIEQALTAPRITRRRAPAALPRSAAHAPLHLPRLNLAFGFARRPPPAAAG